jgi:hypothetical protein
MNTIINPVVSFYKSYEKNINKVRSTLFDDLENISTDFATEARKILEEKLSENNQRPLLGEIFPWIICDLINANAKTTHKISVGWLAIYLYTLFVDEYVDSPKKFSATKFITGSILAKTGLLEMSKFTHKTQFAKYIDNAFSFSAHNQLLDTKFQSTVSGINEKTKYSEGKNYVVLACAGVLASQNSKHSKFIIKFTQTLLLALQYLDDIADYKEDFKQNNYTVLLSDTFRNTELSKFKNFSNKRLLEELLITGSLQRVVEKIQQLLNQAIIYIQENNDDVDSKKASIDLFISLHASISVFNRFLKTECKYYKELPAEKRKYILDRTEKYIPIIAQST